LAEWRERASWCSSQLRPGATAAPRPLAAAPSPALLTGIAGFTPPSRAASARVALAPSRRCPTPFSLLRADTFVRPQAYTTNGDKIVKHQRAPISPPQAAMARTTTAGHGAAQGSAT